MGWHDSDQKGAIKSCKNCGKDFAANGPSQLFCSDYCNQSFKRYSRKCEECGVDRFYSRPSQMIYPLCSACATKKRRAKEPFLCKVKGYLKRYTGDRKRGCREEHRIVVENFLGRKLCAEEKVHHIDFVKTNNELDNLVVIQGHSLHMKTEGTLHKLVPELIRKRVIYFDREDLCYKTNPNLSEIG